MIHRLSQIKWGKKFRLKTESPIGPVHSNTSFLLKDLSPDIDPFLRCKCCLIPRKKVRYGQSNPGTSSAGKNSLHDL